MIEMLAAQFNGCLEFIDYSYTSWKPLFVSPLPYPLTLVVCMDLPRFPRRSVSRSLPEDIIVSTKLQSIKYRRDRFLAVL